MKYKKFIVVLFLLTMLILVSCSKKESKEVNFCQKLSKCEQAKLQLEDNTSKDAYELSVLGKKENTCLVSLAVQKTNVDKLKFLEGLNTVCSQKWSEKFDKIANFNESTCKKYVDTLVVNLMNHLVDENSNICNGELRERLVTK